MQFYCTAILNHSRFFFVCWSQLIGIAVRNLARRIRTQGLRRKRGGGEFGFLISLAVVIFVRVTKGRSPAGTPAGLLLYSMVYSTQSSVAIIITVVVIISSSSSSNRKHSVQWCRRAVVEALTVILCLLITIPVTMAAVGKWLTCISSVYVELKSNLSPAVRRTLVTISFHFVSVHSQNYCAEWYLLFRECYKWQQVSK